ncbi:glycoside hydrolase family 16 protein [Methylobacterium organophilum]|uniref:Endo-1,3-1,4-beta-glycanase ExsH n=1 Tax=Methylobacterium organophilum TaxID=410 RepID=A0ABQ4T9W6_METOR|nr:glycoside hydrolase family 16 protein [Methylobacterium organophilum]GJE28452.1 Endo-1,3-1,4-beta-glycanase ExsH [Methylobacterium organophilum]
MITLPKPQAVLLTALLGSSVLPACAAEPTLDLCGYKPVFTEDFDSLSVASRVLGSARWIAHTPWNGDFGDARFADDAPAGPFSIENGVLRITARRDEAGKWRSGLLAASDGTGAGFGVRYGYFEARMRLPPGAGTWPAFWLGTKRPNTDKTPSIEIDVIEYYGHADAAYSAALHVWYKGADEKRSTHTVHKVPVPSGSLLDSFHTYGVRVTPETITYYLDRKPVWEKPTPAELDKPLFPLVNLALGSGFPIDRTPNPSVLYVDYVHVYAPDPDGQAARCPAASR